jgi:alkanesulfonate monooxygenase SsuD/methylene tetrahydromethanopterin reductase-like flavin-dependent oxidoreductase (luciferase family)/hemerythrin-like domain-containing protein
MTDFGHELRFGAFLTPVADGYAELIRQVTIADEIGLDLVGVQDHPYQPSFLDAWTLLSNLAARTKRITLVPDVVNLPLRPPAVLARSAATLDILSGGRVELGIGAGAFWDGVAAMGGRRLTSGQSVRALEEAITVIRALWTPGRGAVFQGEHYSLNGARPGPFPVHRIGLWVGAYGPRMMDLTGRLGDGWLPSSMYASPEAMARMTALLDEAAVAAGRDPGEIQRIYNIAGRFSERGTNEFLVGPPKQWAAQLTELVLELGVSGFVLAPAGRDVARELRTFADEVAPLIRAEVDGARGVSTTAVSAVAETADPRAEGEQITLWGNDPLGEAERPHVSRPEGTAAGNSNGTGNHLVQIHDHLRTELRQVRDVVAQVASGQRSAAAARSVINDLAMRQNFWTLGSFCAAYCRVLTTHHTIEDEHMFPELVVRQESLAPVVRQLEREHKVIAEVLTALDAALVALMEDDSRLKAVQDHVDLLDQVLTSHLDYEEGELVEPLNRLNMRV